MKNKEFISIAIFLYALLCISCRTDISQKCEVTNVPELEQNETRYKKRDTVTLEELIHPNMDSLRLWENGAFLGRQKSNRDYKSLLNYYFNKETLNVKDIEILYPTSVEEMTWFYSQLKSGESSIRAYMTKIDDLMYFYAVNDSLSCLSRYLNMYFYMDPRIID